MKNLLAFFISFFSIISFAQHPNLNQTWYVKNVRINGITAEIPSDPISFPFVTLFPVGGSDGLIATSNRVTDVDCQVGFTGHVNYTSTDYFNFIDYNPFYSVDECSTSAIDFMNLYISVFEDAMSEQFFYTITTEPDDSKTLIITNTNGDEAVYSNRFFNPAPAEMSEINWFLHNLIIDGMDNITPIFEDEPLTDGCTAFFNDNIDSTCWFYGCWSMDCQANFDYNLSQFYLYINAYSLSDCNNPVFNTYTMLYNSFFEDGIQGAFTYLVSIDGENKSLIITNSNGNQAIYGNTTLSTQNYLETEFSIFPNPVNDFLQFENAGVEITKIEVLDLLGITVRTKTKDFNQIDFTNNSPGVYFVKFYVGEVVFIRKVIKN